MADSTLMHGMRALVTGGARGIGKAAAEALISAGAAAVIADIDGAQDAAERIGAAGHAAGDIGCEQDAEALVKEAERIMGGLDVLVNNAAVTGPIAHPQDLSLADWQETLRTNLTGAMLCSRAALPALRSSGKGSIVNVVSTQAAAGQARGAAYIAAKGGLLSLTRALAVDLAPDAIRVNAVAPGFIDTRMAIMADGRHEHEDPDFREFYLKRRRIPLGRPGTPSDVAGAIVFLASPMSAYITGQMLAVDGGLLATY